MIETARLILRPWQARDREPFAELNADVMDPALAPSESDGLIEAFEARWRTDGFAFAAAERKADGAFVGMVGLQRFETDPPVGACVEIGWRLARACWGQGYATEAARAWADYGFATLGLAELVAFTDPPNARSLAVMRRLGMVRDPGRDFVHAEFPQDGPQVFFALTRAAWAGGRA